MTELDTVLEGRSPRSVLSQQTELKTHPISGIKNRSQTAFFVCLFGSCYSLLTCFSLQASCKMPGLLISLVNFHLFFFTISQV